MSTGSAPPECSVACGGDCCRRFFLHTPATERAEKYAQIIAWRDEGGEMEPWMDEYVLVHEMLIPLAGESLENEPVYTCKHLASDGRCSIYEKRPGLCRRYPNDAPCPSCGFTIGVA